MPKIFQALGWYPLDPAAGTPGIVAAVRAAELHFTDEL
jgi:hypothetical protein